MKRFKLLFRTLEEIEMFLNGESAKGEELLAVNKLSFSFEKSERQFKYFAFFIGYKREAYQDSLIEDLEKNNIEYFYYSFNRLNSEFYKIGKSHKLGYGLASNNLEDVYKDEVLIIKCPTDMLGKFSWQADSEDLSLQAKSMERSYLIVTAIVFALTLFSFVMMISHSFPLHLIVISLLLLLLTFYYYCVKKVYFTIRQGGEFGRG